MIFSIIGEHPCRGKLRDERSQFIIDSIAIEAWRLAEVHFKRRCYQLHTQTYIVRNKFKVN